MTKTKYWLSILAVSVVLIAGSLAVSPIAIADEDDDDDDDEQNIFGIIIQKLDQIIAAIGGIDTSGLATQSSVDNIETDLLSKKSFYEVEDVVTVDVGTNLAGRSILVELNCPNTIPADKQAFNLQSLGVRTHNTNSTGDLILPTKLFFNKTIIDGNFDTVFLADRSSLNLLFDAKLGVGQEGRQLGTLAASDKISFDYYLTGNNKIKAVAIGQMPQGCNVTIDADAPVVRTIDPLQI